VPKEYYTHDMDEKGRILLDGDRKYDIINTHGVVERHTATLRVPPGISAYAFTFGAEQ
jgi:hypothetical protein